MEVGIQGLDAGVLHLDDAILKFEYPIQGFEHHILKFMIFKQFDGLEIVAVDDFSNLRQPSKKVTS